MLNPLKGRKKVLFSDRFGSELHIRMRIDQLRYVPSFSSFKDVNLDDYDILIPQALADIVYVQEHYPQLRRKKCFIPNIEALNLCNDKMLFNDFIIASGHGELIPTVHGELEFPYILKKRIDEYGSRSRIIRNAKEEKIFHKFVTSDDYFRQACVFGPDEHSSHILMVDGKIVYQRTLCFPFEDPLFVKGVGCEPVSRGHEITCDYLDLFESILNSMDFEGICCFDYKVVDGVPKIFEINPRYGGSLTRSLSKMMKVYTRLLGEIDDK